MVETIFFLHLEITDIDRKIYEIIRSDSHHKMRLMILANTVIGRNYDLDVQKLEASKNVLWGQTEHESVAISEPFWKEWERKDESKMVMK